MGWAGEAVPGGAKRRIGGAGHLKEVRRTDDEPIPFGGCTGIFDIKKKGADAGVFLLICPASRSLLKYYYRGIDTQPQAGVAGETRPDGRWQ